MRGLKQIGTFEIILFILSMGRMGYAQNTVDDFLPLRPSHSERFIIDHKKQSQLGLHSQIVPFVGRDNQKSLSLMSGRNDLALHKKLWTFLIEAKPTLSFYAERLSLHFQNKWTTKHSEHYRFTIHFDGIPIQHSLISAHFNKSSWKAITIAIPEFSKVIPASAELRRTIKNNTEKTLYFAVHDDVLKPVWHYTTNDHQHRFEHQWEDAYTGEWISSHAASFDLAKGRVQIENSRDSQTTLKTLPDLKRRDMLDGLHFSIFTDHEVGRVKSSKGLFDFSPADRQRFDQVAVYENLTSSLQWFQDEFGYSTDGLHIPVTIASNLDGNPNNARYVPATNSSSEPQLVFGLGTEGEFENLARDKDVAMHELSHHVIFRFIDDSRGYAGALHEGFADYFAYAYSDDPFLAEQIIVDAPYIRTALVDAERTYDNPYISRNQHALGQIWSAFLWETRKKIGPDFDQIVYQSLFYLNAGSNFGDAIEALLLSDQDSYPLRLTEKSSDLANRSMHSCDILESAVNRGYTGYLMHLDGACGLDLKAIAAESAAVAAGASHDKDRRGQIFPSCGQIKNSNHVNSNIIIILFLLLPLIIPYSLRKYRQEGAS